MKKFLAFLLIAVIACTTVEDLELEGKWWDKIKNAFNKAWKWLKDNGVIDALIDVGKTILIGWITGK